MLERISDLISNNDGGALSLITRIILGLDGFIGSFITQAVALGDLRHQEE
jgi:hypothetical protein